MSINRLLYCFLLFHLIIWTILPSLINHNLPLDTIEALAWGNDLQMGYWKHPPLSAYVVELFYVIFGTLDWGYYFCSQIFIFINFVFIYKICLLKTKSLESSVYCTLLSSLIFYYGYSSTEFNVNISLLPFWSGSIYYFLISLEKNKFKHWAKLGIFSAFAFLSKYLVVYLFFVFIFIFLKNFFKKNKSYKFLISILFFILITLPHVVWIFNNDFHTIKYGSLRLTASDYDLLFFRIEEPYNIHFFKKDLIKILFFFKDQFFFIFKQLTIYFLFFTFHFIFFDFKYKKKEVKNNLTLIFFVPIILVFLSALFSMGKVRTMWLSPFYSILSILITLIFFEIKIKIKKINILTFLILYLISPMLFVIINGSNISKEYTEKRTRDNREKRIHYNGREVANLVDKSWKENFKAPIKYVIGDEWYAGNLSYYLKSRPKVYYHNVSMQNNIRFNRNKIKLNTVMNKGSVIIQKNNWHKNSLTNYKKNNFFFLKDENGESKIIECNLKEVKNNFDLLIYLIPPNCKLV